MLQPHPRLATIKLLCRSCRSVGARGCARVRRLIAASHERDDGNQSQAKQFFHMCCREFVLPVDCSPCTHRKLPDPFEPVRRVLLLDPPTPFRYPEQVRERSQSAQCTKGSRLAKRENQKPSGQEFRARAVNAHKRGLIHICRLGFLRRVRRQPERPSGRIRARRF